MSRRNALTAAVEAHNLCPSNRAAGSPCRPPARRHVRHRGCLPAEPRCAVGCQQRFSPDRPVRSARPPRGRCHREGGEGARPARQPLPSPSVAGDRRMRARLGRREKVFGPGRAVPLDRNAKARIMAYAKAWGARHRQPGQHRGPITRAFLEVLEALLWGFHNARTGCCFPGYEAIAAKAECARSTVAEALKVLELGRRADLGAPHRPDPGARARPVRPMGEPLARHPDVQCLRVPRPAAASRGRAGFQVRKSVGNTESRDSHSCTCTCARPGQPAGARSGPIRCRDRRKIAHEGEWWDRRSRLIQEPAMPKSKHRRKAGGKAVPHPGRQRAEPPGWVASQHHGPDDEAAGGHSQPRAAAWRQRALLLPEDSGVRDICISIATDYESKSRKRRRRPRTLKFDPDQRSATRILAGCGGP